MPKHKGARRAPVQKKPPLTHFLCLPLVTSDSRPQLQASFAAFEDGVSAPDATASGNIETDDENNHSEQEIVRPSVHPRAIRPVGSLHCTLGVMSLDSDKLAEAVEFLENLDVTALLRGAANQSSGSTATIPATDGSSAHASLDRPITPPMTERASGPLTVDLKGLESMHAPQKTSILYIAPEDPTNRLYPFCLALQKLFRDKGFLVEDNRQLKLHATIVNTIYARGRKQPQRSGTGQHASGPSAGGDNGKAQGHGTNANAPLNIDATSILERYKDFVWAESVVLDCVAICQMGAKKVLDDGGKVKDEEYIEVASIVLPT